MECESLNFYWMVEGFKDFRSDKPFVVYWEDFYYTILKDGEEIRKGSTTIEAKSMVRYEIERINGEFYDKYEIEDPGYREGILNTVIADDLTWEGLLNSNTYHYSYAYSSLDDPDKYEIKDMINLPFNDDFMSPCYITIYIPEEYITKDLVHRYMKLYIKRFFDIEIDEIEWKTDHDKEYLQKEYDEEVKRMEEWKKMSEKGEKMRIVMLPQVLSFMIGKELVDKWISRGLVSAEKIEDCENEYLLEFVDGHTELSSTTEEMIDIPNG